MANALLPGVSRPFGFRLWLGLPLLAMGLLLWLDPSGLDFAIAEKFYVPGAGFIGRKSYWLENILHDRAKEAVILLSVLLFLGFVASWFAPKLREIGRASCRERVF